MSADKIYYLLNVKLVDKVPMLESRRKMAADWLKTWTPKNNFKAIISNSLDTVIRVFSEELAKAVERHDYPPGNFEFSVFASEVEMVNGHRRLDWNAEAAARMVASNINAGGLE